MTTQQDTLNTDVLILDYGWSGVINYCGVILTETRHKTKTQCNPCIQAEVYSLSGPLLGIDNSTLKMLLCAENENDLKHLKMTSGVVTGQAMHI